MNTKAVNQPLVAGILILLCLVAIGLGVFQLVKSSANPQSVAVNDGGLSSSKLNGDRLVYIALDGMIIEGEDDSSLFTKESSAVKARRLLYLAAKDDGVKGILLRINSPGGTVAMSQELYDAVLYARKKKPVVVSMGDLAASGGYYTASAADKIIANPGTLTASIGVIMQTMNFKDLMQQKLGIQSITVKSGKFKDMMSPYRAPTPEDLAMVQKIIDDSYHQFLRAVIYGRTLGLTQVAEKERVAKSIASIADGRVILGENAIKYALVDGLGGLEEAKGDLQDLAGKRFHLKHPDRLPLEEYEAPMNIFQLLGIDSRSWVHPVSQSASLSPKEMLPTSVRYANQPLWMMESLR